MMSTEEGPEAPREPLRATDAAVQDLVHALSTMTATTTRELITTRELAADVKGGVSVKEQLLQLQKEIVQLKKEFAVSRKL